MKKIKRSFVDGFTPTDDGMNKSFGYYVELSNRNTITLKEAREVYSKVAKKENTETIPWINIDLSNYSEYSDEGQPMFSSEELGQTRIGSDKSARYYARQNRLVIREDGCPIYENYNGVICDDEAALGDSLL